MQTGHQPENNSTSKSKIYFGLAFVFLFILALVWSIDSSFFYVLLGISTYFLWLGFKNKPIQNEPSGGEKFTQSEPVDEGIDVSAELRKIFEQKPLEVKPKTAATPGQPIRPKVGLIIFGFVVTSFIIIAIGFSLSDDGDDAVMYFQQGDSFYNEGQYDSACRYYRKAFKMQEDYTEALTGYGNALMIQTQNDSAIIMYDKALSINPEYEPALYKKALTLYYQKNYDQSIRETNDLLKENSTNFEAMQLMGDNFYNQEQYDTAKVWYDSAYNNGLRNQYLCYLLGYVYQTKRDNNRAVSLYQEALKYDSSVVDIYQRLGELLPGENGNWYRNKAAELQAQNDQTETK